MDYPVAERQDIVDDLFGHRVADPYRWLEDASTAQTAQWLGAQDDLVRPYLDGLPGRERLRARMTELLGTGVVGGPAWRGTRYFFVRRDPGQEHAAVLVREADGTERTLIDPAVLDPSGKTTLDTWQPNKEGRLLAYQVSVGGDEVGSLLVIDVDSGEIVDGPLPRTRYSPVAWLPGGQTFYYVARLAPELVPVDESQYHHRVLLHRVGTSADDDVMVFGEGLDKTSYFGVSVSRDGRWLTLSRTLGTAPRNDLWLADISSGELETLALQEIQIDVDATTGVSVGNDGRLYVFTDRDAPRGQALRHRPHDTLVRDLARAGAGGPRGRARRLRDPRRAGAASADGGPYPPCRQRAHRARPRHRRTDPAGCAARRRVARRGRRAARGWHRGMGRLDRVHHAVVRAALRRDRRRAVDVGRAPGKVAVPAVHSQVVTYPSKDGTLVRMFVVSPAAVPDHPRPTTLYGYGGFNIPMTPGFSAGILSWVEAGGVYAIACLRGGSEEGEEWHRAGRRDLKQNVFDDFAAAAEWLVAQGWTTPDQLAVSGGSNGGLLVGAALTQRPELYAAVICSAPLLDMVRYEGSGAGPAVVRRVRHGVRPD